MGLTKMKWLLAVLLLLSVAGLGQAGEKDIIERLGKAGAGVTETQGYFVVMLPAQGVFPFLKDLCELQRLGSLTLRERRVTDAEMQTIGSLSHLRGLLLGGCAVTDAHLKQVAKLRKLRGLSLDGTRVTDAGLEELAVLSDLRHLHLNGTTVTAEGVARLQKALPECVIHH
jgi:hypothetical protein